MIKFKAVRQEVKARSLASLDTQVRLVLLTEQKEPLQLGLDDAETLYEVTIERVE